MANNDNGTYDTKSAKEITLAKLTHIMHQLGASEIYAKKLAPNDNSKNQPYFGGHLTDLPFIPSGEIKASESVSKKTKDPRRKIKYQASLNLSWIDPDGTTFKAPNSKLIYYPQYPEVRFSGFLRDSKAKISKWMSPDKQGRSENRWLILGINQDKSIYAYLATPESNLSTELQNTNLIKVSKIFCRLDIINNHSSGRSTRNALIARLLEIHNMGWIKSQKLNADMTSSPYKALNAGGYTLEAMLGISPNGIAEPDYLGWEVKQFGVKRFPRIGTKPTTLMTPEPDGGFYTNKGTIDFVKTYGYADKSGKPDRLNFGGKHIIGEMQNLTKLTMQLHGFDPATSTIINAAGEVALIDVKGNITSSWSFAKLMNHWKKKHSQAVYIPCIKQQNATTTEYRYGKDIELGSGTNFEIFLAAMHLGAVFYDPGTKLEHVSTNKPKIKRRNQFRVNHKHLDSLYNKFEFIDITT